MDIFYLFIALFIKWQCPCNCSDSKSISVIQSAPILSVLPVHQAVQACTAQRCMPTCTWLRRADTILLFSSRPAWCVDFIFSDPHTDHIMIEWDSVCGWSAFDCKAALYFRSVLGMYWCVLNHINAYTFATYCHWRLSYCYALQAGFSALHLAAQNGHNESARILLFAGCSPDHKNGVGFAQFHFCFCLSIFPATEHYYRSQLSFFSSRCSFLTLCSDYFTFFTALHGMQARSSDENSVRLSVRPSVRPSVHLSVTRVYCDKTVEKSVHIFIPYERTFSLVFWEEEWLVGGDPFYLKFWVNWPALEKNRRFSTNNRS